MNNIEDKIMFGFYGIFGAVIGLVIFLVVLGGWEPLLTDTPATALNGTVALLICLSICGGWGLLAYKLSDRELGSGSSGFLGDQAGAILLVKRLMVIATCLAGAYFIWQLARGL